MKKAIAIMVAVLFAFALTSVSFAAEKKAAPAPMEQKAAPMEKKAAPEAAKPMAEKPKVKMVTGEVKAVDAKAMTIAVMKKDKETVVTVNDKTKIMMGKEKKTLADLKAGDKVTVKYTEADGKKMAKSVAIKTEMAEKKMEKKSMKKEPAEKK